MYTVVAVSGIKILFLTSNVIPTVLKVTSHDWELKDNIKMGLTGSVN
jgi:hypothetical protein